MAEMTKEAEPVAQAWPPLKKALWNVVTGAELNSPKYVNAYVLTDKLYAAALAATPPGRDPAMIDDEMVERAWAGIVGRDVAPICHQASVVRGDIRSALIAALATPVMTEER